MRRHTRETVSVFCMTWPSKMEPVMSFADIFLPSNAERPMSGCSWGLIWPRWIWPSSSAMKRMRCVQGAILLIDEECVRGDCVCSEYMKLRKVMWLMDGGPISVVGVKKCDLSGPTFEVFRCISGRQL